MSQAKTMIEQLVAMLEALPNMDKITYTELSNNWCYVSAKNAKGDFWTKIQLTKKSIKNLKINITEELL